MDGKKLKELLEDAGYDVRSYSGRAMYGKECVGVDSRNSRENPFKMAMSVAVEVMNDVDSVTTGDEAMEQAHSTLQELADLRVCQDSMGLGIITYFPDVEWPEEEATAEEASFDIDWADEGDPFGKDYANARGLKVKTINRNGPGGGWPIIRFSGTEAAIRKAAADCDAGDDCVIDSVEVA